MTQNIRIRPTRAFGPGVRFCSHRSVSSWNISLHCRGAGWCSKESSCPCSGRWLWVYRAVLLSLGEACLTNTTEDTCSYTQTFAKVCILPLVSLPGAEDQEVQGKTCPSILALNPTPAPTPANPSPKRQSPSGGPI